MEASNLGVFCELANLMMSQISLIPTTRPTWRKGSYRTRDHGISMLHHKEHNSAEDNLQLEVSSTAIAAITRKPSLSRATIFSLQAGQLDMSSSKTPLHLRPMENCRYPSTRNFDKDRQSVYFSISYRWGSVDF